MCCRVHVSLYNIYLSFLLGSEGHPIGELLLVLLGYRPSRLSLFAAATQNNTNAGAIHVLSVAFVAVVGVCGQGVTYYFFLRGIRPVVESLYTDIIPAPPSGGTMDCSITVAPSLRCVCVEGDSRHTSKG